MDNSGEQKHKPCLRAIAFFVTVMFSVTSVALPAPVQPAENPAAAGISIAVPTAISVPKEIGTVQTQRIDPKSGRVIVLVQDAHAVIDAQENIQKLLTHLQRNCSAGAFFVEGAKGKLDPTLIRTYPDPKIKKQVLAGYRNAAELSGAELASALNESEGNFEGLEDWNLYTGNFIAYQQAQAAKKDLQARLKNIKAGLDAQKEKILSAKLREFQTTWEDFRAERISLLDLLLYLAKFNGLSKGRPEYAELARLIQSIGYEKSGKQEALEPVVKQIAAEFKTKFARNMDTREQTNFYMTYQNFLTGKITVGQMLKYLVQAGAERGFRLKLTPQMRRLLGHTELLSEIQGSRLYDELQKFLPEAGASLVRNKEESDLLAKLQKLFVLEDLVKLELTHDGLAAYQKDPESYLELLGDVKSREALRPALEFYDYALRRDRSFYDRIQKAPADAKTLVLIAGGFHTNGLERILREKGESYAVITPRISTLTGKENYFKVMAGDLSYKDYLKTTYYDALMRHAIRKLTEPLNEPDFKKTLKLWRDNLVRDLAAKRRITDLGQYTRYLDELNVVYQERFGKGQARSRDEILAFVQKQLEKFRDDALAAVWKKFEGQLKIFTDGLQGLIDKKQLDTEHVTGLLNDISRAKPMMLGAPSSMAPDSPLIITKLLSLAGITDKLATPEQILEAVTPLAANVEGPSNALIRQTAGDLVKHGFSSEDILTAKEVGAVPDQMLAEPVADVVAELGAMTGQDQKTIAARLALEMAEQIQARRAEIQIQPVAPKIPDTKVTTLAAETLTRPGPKLKGPGLKEGEKATPGVERGKPGTTARSVPTPTEPVRLRQEPDAPVRSETRVRDVVVFSGPEVYPVSENLGIQIQNIRVLGGKKSVDVKKLFPGNEFRVRTYAEGEKFVLGYTAVEIMKINVLIGHPASVELRFESRPELQVEPLSTKDLAKERGRLRLADDLERLRELVFGERPLIEGEEEYVRELVEKTFMEDVRTGSESLRRNLNALGRRQHGPDFREVSPEDFRKMQHVRISDICKFGQQKNVYQVTLLLDDVTEIKFVMAMKTPRGQMVGEVKGKIKSKEIDDKQWASAETYDDDHPVTPVFVASYALDDGHSIFFEEYVEGPTLEDALLEIGRKENFGVVDSEGLGSVEGTPALAQVEKLLGNASKATLDLWKKSETINGVTVHRGIKDSHLRQFINTPSGAVIVDLDYFSPHSFVQIFLRICDYIYRTPYGKKLYPIRSLLQLIMDEFNGRPIFSDEFEELAIDDNGNSIPGESTKGKVFRDEDKDKYKGSEGVLLLKYVYYVTSGLDSIFSDKSVKIIATEDLPLMMAVMEQLQRWFGESPEEKKKRDEGKKREEWTGWTELEKGQNYRGDWDRWRRYREDHPQLELTDLERFFQNSFDVFYEIPPEDYGKIAGMIRDFLKAYSQSAPAGAALAEDTQPTGETPKRSEMRRAMNALALIPVTLVFAGGLVAVVAPGMFAGMLEGLVNLITSVGPWILAVFLPVVIGVVVWQWFSDRGTTEEFGISEEEWIQNAEAALQDSQEKPEYAAYVVKRFLKSGISPRALMNALTRAASPSNYHYMLSGNSAERFVLGLGNDLNRRRMRREDTFGAKALDFFRGLIGSGDIFVAEGLTGTEKEQWRQKEKIDAVLSILQVVARAAEAPRSETRSESRAAAVTEERKFPGNVVVLSGSDWEKISERLGKFLKKQRGEVLLAIQVAGSVITVAAAPSTSWSWRGRSRRQHRDLAKKAGMDNGTTVGYSIATLNISNNEKVFVPNWRLRELATNMKITPNKNDREKYSEEYIKEKNKVQKFVDGIFKGDKGKMPVRSELRVGAKMWAAIALAGMMFFSILVSEAAPRNALVAGIPRESIQLVQKELGVEQAGVIGPKTIRALQELRGLEKDGIFGPKTKAVFDEVLGEAIQKQTVPGDIVGVSEIPASAAATFSSAPLSANEALVRTENLGSILGQLDRNQNFRIFKQVLETDPSVGLELKIKILSQVSFNEFLARIARLSGVSPQTFIDAAKENKISEGQSMPVELLVAIVLQETNFKPSAINVNKDGSIDVGLCQINLRTANDPKFLKEAIRRKILPADTPVPFKLDKNGRNETLIRYLQDPRINIRYAALIFADGAKATQSVISRLARLHGIKSGPFGAGADLPRTLDGIGTFFAAYNTGVGNVTKKAGAAFRAFGNRGPSNYYEMFPGGKYGPAAMRYLRLVGSLSGSIFSDPGINTIQLASIAGRSEMRGGGKDYAGKIAMLAILGMLAFTGVSVREAMRKPLAGEPIYSMLDGTPATRFLPGYVQESDMGIFTNSFSSSSLQGGQCVFVMAYSKSDPRALGAAHFFPEAGKDLGEQLLNVEDYFSGRGIKPQDSKVIIIQNNPQGVNEYGAVINRFFERYGESPVLYSLPAGAYGAYVLADPLPNGGWNVKVKESVAPAELFLDSTIFPSGEFQPGPRPEAREPGAAGLEESRSEMRGGKAGLVFPEFKEPVLNVLREAVQRDGTVVVLDVASGADPQFMRGLISLAEKNGISPEQIKVRSVDDLRGSLARPDEASPDVLQFDFRDSENRKKYGLVKNSQDLITINNINYTAVDLAGIAALMLRPDGMLLVTFAEKDFEREEKAIFGDTSDIIERTEKVLKDAFAEDPLNDYEVARVPRPPDYLQSNPRYGSWSEMIVVRKTAKPTEARDAVPTPAVGRVGEKQVVPAVSPEIAKDADWRTVFKNNNLPIYVEVGVGNGNKSLDIARSQPDVNFIFIEPDPGAFRELLRAAQVSGLKNVRIVRGKDSELFELQKGAGFVSLIYCVAPYFNSQWPYFFSKGPNAPTFRRAMGLLKEGGEILIVPDETMGGDWHGRFKGKFSDIEIGPASEYFPKLKESLDAYHKKVLDFQYAAPIVITKTRTVELDRQLQDVFGVPELKYRQGVYPYNGSLKNFDLAEPDVLKYAQTIADYIKARADQFGEIPDFRVLQVGPSSGTASLATLNVLLKISGIQNITYDLVDISAGAIENTRLNLVNFFTRLGFTIPDEKIIGTFREFGFQKGEKTVTVRLFVKDFREFVKENLGESGKSQGYHLVHFDAPVPISLGKGEVPEDIATEMEMGVYQAIVKGMASFLEENGRMLLGGSWFQEPGAGKKPGEELSDEKSFATALPANFEVMSLKVTEEEKMSVDPVRVVFEIRRKTGDQGPATRKRAEMREKIRIEPVELKFGESYAMDISGTGISGIRESSEAEWPTAAEEVTVGRPVVRNLPSTEEPASLVADLCTGLIFLRRVPAGVYLYGRHSYFENIIQLQSEFVTAFANRPLAEKENTVIILIGGTNYQGVTGVDKARNELEMLMKEEFGDEYSSRVLRLVPNTPDTVVEAIVDPATQKLFVRTMRREKTKRAATGSNELVLARGELRFGGLFGDLNPATIAEKAAPKSGVGVVHNELRARAEARRAEMKETLDERIKLLMDRFNNYKTSETFTAYLLSRDFSDFMDRTFGEFGNVGAVVSSIIGFITNILPGVGGETAGYYDANMKQLNDEKLGAVMAWLATQNAELTKRIGEQHLAVMMNHPGQDSEIVIKMLEMLALERLIILHQKNQPLGRAWNKVAPMTNLVFDKKNPTKTAAILAQKAQRASQERNLVALWTENLEVGQMNVYSVMAEIGRIADPRLKGLACAAIRYIFLKYAALDKAGQQEFMAKPELVLADLNKMGFDAVIKPGGNGLVFDMEKFVQNFAAEMEIQTAA